MTKSKLWLTLTVLLVAAMVLAACPAPVPAPAEGQPAEQPAEAAAPGDTGGVQIPEIEEGKFNVAFVYVGPIGDGGWTYAHNEGRLYVEEQLGDKVHTVYLESVPEGADAERVVRSLARSGFDAIFTTSFGFHGLHRHRGCGVPRHRLRPRLRL